jgi:hypothetical protein
MLKYKTVLFVVLFPLLVIVQSQTQKEIKQQQQTWISVNNTIMLDNHCAVLLDLYHRSTDFVDSESFYLFRCAVGYITEPKKAFAFGYGHFWFAPINSDFHTFTNEDFPYQLFQFTSNMGNVSVMNSFRNEQRWQDIIVNDTWTGVKRFSNRFRYLLGFSIPIFLKKNIANPLISDEILLQFGKDNIYNNFDQNRFFKTFNFPKTEF